MLHALHLSLDKWQRSEGRCRSHRPSAMSPLQWPPRNSSCCEPPSLCTSSGELQRYYTGVKYGYHSDGAVVGNVYVQETAAANDSWSFDALKEVSTTYVSVCIWSSSEHLCMCSQVYASLSITKTLLARTLFDRHLSLNQICIIS